MELVLKEYVHVASRGERKSPLLDGHMGTTKRLKTQPPRDGKLPAPEFRVAIVGGGPAGLFTAWNLSRKTGTACKITILEATDRLGGKILTRSFPGVGLYEAGVAEIYDYSALGPDPLRELIEKDLGLQIKYIQGGACVLDGKLLHSIDDLEDHFGAHTKNAAKAFRARCASLLSPATFYTCTPTDDNQHPWAQVSGEDILATEVPDERARRYIRVMAHSDVAAAPHLTSGLIFLKNVLMDVNGYMDIFSVVGGNEQIVSRMSDQLDAEVHLNTPVRSVEPLEDGTFRLEAGSDGVRETFIADFVVLALPLTALSLIEWRSENLQRALAKHISHFDRPAHYVRATLLFERPFWREHLSGAWWMVDAFDGCAVYDEGARHELGNYGALGFLIAGNAALWLANLTDDQIEALCLDALPPALAHGRKLIVDRRVHRWMASVNALPGGHPARKLLENHRPDPTNLAGVFVIGDYIFDATLNGAFDSADAATDMMLSEILVRRRSHRIRVGQRSAKSKGKSSSSNGRTLAERDRFLSDPFISDMLRIGFGLESAKILIAGPASRTGTPASYFDGDLTALPFPDAHFDVVIETGLCYLPRDRVSHAAGELRRVARRGIVLSSITCDLAIDLLERYDLLAGIETLASRWDWAEQLALKGFDLALLDPVRLAQAWERGQAAGAGPGSWYDEPESLLYSFYECRRADKHTSPVLDDGATTCGGMASASALNGSRAVEEALIHPSTIGRS
jgi:protoporphyrinogen oxidase